jgi:hypothetical protein
MPSAISKTAAYPLGERTVRRMGYGAMQLAGPHVFGPPRDRAQAVAVLREAVASGVNHIDTCDYYGPHVVNQIIREALHPYDPDLTLVTKVGARRDKDGGWLPAQSPAELTSAVHDNLRNLGVETLHVVNLRLMGGMAPTEGPIEPQWSTLVGLQQQGLIQHLGISNATAGQVREAQAIAPVACVQNMYNLAQRHDDPLIDALAGQGVAYVPYFPLGGFAPLQSAALSAVAKRLGATPLQVALAWLLRRSPNVLLIPGTSSVGHLRENLAAAEIALPEDAMAELEGIGAAGA